MCDMDAVQVILHYSAKGETACIQLCALPFSETSVCPSHSPVHTCSLPLPAKYPENTRDAHRPLGIFFGQRVGWSGGGDTRNSQKTPISARGWAHIWSLPMIPWMMSNQIVLIPNTSSPPRMTSLHTPSLRLTWVRFHSDLREFDSLLRLLFFAYRIGVKLGIISKAVVTSGFFL